jgi:hypothetical protein
MVLIEMHELKTKPRQEYYGAALSAVLYGRMQYSIKS